MAVLTLATGQTARINISVNATGAPTTIGKFGIALGTPGIVSVAQIGDSSGWFILVTALAPGTTTATITHTWTDASVVTSSNTITVVAPARPTAIALTLSTPI